ncbi:MAG: V-type ATP synthase subunit D [Kiloniellales bacterium]|nr:V-type ATP synthase subunit D [Kiloniellales bacterium]
MARLQLSKSALNREERQLATFERFLPSLDLKRRQLLAERGKARERLAATREEIEALRRDVVEAIPMLANRDVDLTGLARIAEVGVGTENVLGARLPTLDAVRVEIHPYAFMAKPQWVDRVAADLECMVALRLRLQVEARRLALLEVAVKKITQRVNLFDKVLIPRARGNIKKIEVFLADAERAGVVRSKLAKRKHALQAPP